LDGLSWRRLQSLKQPQPTNRYPITRFVEALVETLSFRHIGVVQEEYAVSPDGAKMFGVLDLETQMEGCRFSIGIRNSHDKSIRLGLTAGLRVFVCSNMAFSAISRRGQCCIFALTRGKAFGSG
jgi:hypothetical protein